MPNAATQNIQTPAPPVDTIDITGVVGAIHYHHNEGKEPFAWIQLAVKDYRLDDDGMYGAQTKWYSVHVFSGCVAHLQAHNVNKGSRVRVKGTLGKRTYTDKNNQPQTETVVTAASIGVVVQTSSQQPQSGEST